MSLRTPPCVPCTPPRVDGCRELRWAARPYKPIFSFIFNLKASRVPHHLRQSLSFWREKVSLFHIQVSCSYSASKGLCMWNTQYFDMFHPPFQRGRGDFPRGDGDGISCWVPPPVSGGVHSHARNPLRETRGRYVCNCCPIQSRTPCGGESRARATPRVVAPLRSPRAFIPGNRGFRRGPGTKKIPSTSAAIAGVPVRGSDGIAHATSGTRDDGRAAPVAAPRCSSVPLGGLTC